jgi:site-specific DNA recombinase
MSPQKRAVILARVSTERQSKLYSLDCQLDQEQAYCDEVGLVVVAEFKDDTSGRNMDRDGLEEACRMLENDQADVLVTWKFDRLHRNYVNSVLLRERIRNAGKELHYAQTRQVSGKTARERLPEDIQYMLAEIEADDIAERLNMGKRRAIEKGQRWVGIFKPPYGYDKVRHSHDSKMVINEEQAKVIRQVFEWYVHGDEEGKPLGVPTIANKLTALGIPTPGDTISSRKHWPKRGFGVWPKGALYRILRENAYNGTFYHYQFKMVNGVKQANYDKSEWRGVPSPQIVDEALFLAAQEKLNAGQRLSKRSSVESYLVGRRITCECGYKMQANKTTHTHTLKGEVVKTYRSLVYRCPGRYASDSRMHRCDMPQLQYKEVDDRVWEWVKEDIGNPKVLERKLLEIQEGQREENRGKEETQATILKHKAELEADLKSLATLYLNSAMPKHIVDELVAEKSHALKLTMEELSKITHELQTPLNDATIQSLLMFSVAFQERLEEVEKSFEGRRTVIDGLDVTVTALRQDGEVHLKLRSILRPQGMTILLAPPPHSWVANADPSGSKDRACAR